MVLTYGTNLAPNKQPVVEVLSECAREVALRWRLVKYNISVN